MALEIPKGKMEAESIKIGAAAAVKPAATASEHKQGLTRRTKRVDVKRRNFLRGLATIAGAATAQTAVAQHVHHPAAAKEAVRSAPPAATVPPDKLGPGVVPVITPDVPDMPWRLEDGVKVFNIAAEHVRTEFVPGRIVDAWGFNGSVPGPTIQINEGDRVRLIVENRLPEGFSMHWHGLEIPHDMDGMPGISQDPIAPDGERPSTSASQFRCSTGTRAGSRRATPSSPGRNRRSHGSSFHCSRGPPTCSTSI